MIIKLHTGSDDLPTLVNVDSVNYFQDKLVVFDTGTYLVVAESLDEINVKLIGVGASVDRASKSSTKTLDNRR